MTAPAVEQPQQQDNQSTARDRIAAAAAAAAALYAASRTPAAIGSIALASVRRTAQAVDQGGEAAARIITRLWEATDPYDPESVEKFAQQAGQVIVTAQRAVVTATAGSQVAMLRAAGVQAAAPNLADIPDDVRGASVHFGADAPTVHTKPRVTITYQGDSAPVQQTVTRADSEPSQIYQRAAVVYRVRTAAGDDHATANAAAVQRIQDITDGNVMLAQRLAEQQTLRKAQASDARVIGYRRVIHPELSKGGVCGLCVAASDRVYHVEELKPIHLRCKCTVAPVTTDHDPGFRLNDDDLSGLYTDAGQQVGRHSSTFGRDLKRTRYDIVHHSELGPVLTRVKGEKVPYYSTDAPAAVAENAGRSATRSAAPVKAAAKGAESDREVAQRHLPALRASLESLRGRGFSEDSGPVQYHRQQIAKFEQHLAAAR